MLISRGKFKNLTNSYNRKKRTATEKENRAQRARSISIDASDADRQISALFRTSKIPPNNGVPDTRSGSRTTPTRDSWALLGNSGNVEADRRSLQSPLCIYVRTRSKFNFVIGFDSGREREEKKGRGAAVGRRVRGARFLNLAASSRRRRSTARRRRRDGPTAAIETTTVVACRT